MNGIDRDRCSISSTRPAHLLIESLHFHVLYPEKLPRCCDYQTILNTHPWQTRGDYFEQSLSVRFESQEEAEIGSTTFP